jgi:aldose 1-epimerase
MQLTVAPDVGGSISRFASEHRGRMFDWMRPATQDALANRSAGSTSSFPMVPFSNRIRNGRFRFRGRTIQLEQNFRPEPHAIHGHAWRHPWQIVDSSSTTLIIEYQHAADSWPWRYRAQQTFHLTNEHLTVRFSVTNESTDDMPVGFGLHPYFVRTADATIRANVGDMWRADNNAMPDTLVGPPEQLLLDGTGLKPDLSPLDNNFVNFGGQVLIDWPERQARLEINADPIYQCLVVYTPAEQSFFCVEPATNHIDGFNLADEGRDDTGIIVVEPNDTAVGNVTFRPRLL